MNFLEENDSELLAILNKLENDKTLIDLSSSKKTLCIWAIFLLGKCGVLHI